jgi:hypothetical protein
VFGNTAFGGDSDGVAGDGLGGGVYNAAAANIILKGKKISQNLAVGGSGGTANGTGFGGGICNDGDVIIDANTRRLTRKNFADIGPDFFGL